MNINRLIEQRDEYKSKVIRFAVLSGIFLALTIFNYFTMICGIFFFGAVLSELSYVSSDYVSYLDIVMILFIAYLYIKIIAIVLCAIGIEAFIPAIVIYSINLGKKNKILDEYYETHEDEINTANVHIGKLILERDACKRNIKKFATTSGIFIIVSVLCYFQAIIGTIFLALLSDEILSEGANYVVLQDFIALLAMINFFVNILNFILFAIGSEIFIPFIIINSIKLGTRNSKIDKYFEENKNI